MTPLVWALVGAAVVCWPAPAAVAHPARPPVRAGRRAGRRGRERAGHRVGHRRRRRGDDEPPRLGALAGLAVGGLLVALAGPAALPAAILAAPLGVPLAARLGRRSSGHDAALPFSLDLAAAALRSGQPVSRALQLAAPVASPATASALARVAGLLELGTEPREAWAAVTIPALAPVAAAARRSADSGARLADGFEQVADDLRRAARASAVARGQRAGVLAMAPLGLCFLPAFVCLGVVPVVVGVAGAAFGRLG